MNKLADALKAIQSNDARGMAIAVVRIRQAVDWPHGRDVPLAELRQWSKVLRAIALCNDFDDLADVAELYAACEHDAFDEEILLYRIGYELIEARLPMLAATYLWRCQEIAPTAENVSEFIIALEDVGKHEEAYQFLLARRELRAQSYTCQMLFGFNAAKTGRVDIALGVIGDLWRRNREARDSGLTVRTIEGFILSVHGAIGVGAHPELA